MLNEQIVAIMEGGFHTVAGDGDNFISAAGIAVRTDIYIMTMPAIFQRIAGTSCSQLSILEGTLKAAFAASAEFALCLILHGDHHCIDQFLIAGIQQPIAVHVLLFMRSQFARPAGYTKES